VVFGPGGEGLHSLEEYVRVDEVLACRDALVEVARRFCE
jgi:acetylornithine deacetylase/succinyl-diaminopimelate desuccinylase-like protein